MTPRPTFFLIPTIFAAAFFVCESRAAQDATTHARPNILVILADDIGYGDLSCTGARHAKTPAIDRLAREGIRCTNAHSPASTCTPTRRALLTGTYSWRQKAGSSIAPGDAPLLISPETVTLPSLLQKAGYHTGAIGKWHLGLGPEAGPDWNGTIKPGPGEIGFHESFLIPATGDRVPTVYVENHRVAGLNPQDPIRVDYKQKVGTEPTGRENPEALKLKHTHGHDQTIVNGVGRIGWMSGGASARWVDEDMADTLTQKGVEFLERNAGKPFFLYFATHNIHVPRVPHSRWKGTSGAGTRADAIHELDGSVERLLETLDRLKLTDQTLVVFTSDNGGVMDDGYEDVGRFDYHPNAPLKGFKGSIWEGGHRVPFLARWPGHIAPGTVSDALMAHLDMSASLASVIGVPLPEGQFRDSFNVMPALLGQKIASPLRPHFVAHNGGVQGPFSLQVGDWKYLEATPPVRTADSRQKQNPPPGQGAGVRRAGLYNLAQDLSEEKNLAESEGAKLAEMKALLQKLRDSDSSR